MTKDALDSDVIFKQLRTQISLEKEKWIMKCMAYHYEPDITREDYKLVDSPSEYEYLEHTFLEFRGRRIGEWKVYVDGTAIQMKGEVIHVSDRNSLKSNE